MKSLIALILIVMLVSVALLKIVPGHDESFVLPAWLFYAAAGIELAVAGLLAVATWRRPQWLRPTCIGLLIAFTIALAWQATLTAPCGCLGRAFAANQRLQIVVAGSFCVLACLLLGELSRGSRTSSGVTPANG